MINMPFGGHKFKTSKQDKRSDLRRFFFAFFAFALVFGSISAVVILKHNDISLRSIFSGEKETDASQETTADNQQISPVKLSGKSNFLIYCAANDGSEIYFLQIVEADMDNCVLNVRPLNPDGKTAEGKAFAAVLKEGGVEKLVTAVEKLNNIKINKYIGSNADTFALAINYMDGFQYNVSRRIEYRNDEYTLILTKGKQTIKGETLLKYFRYCKTLGTEGLKTQGLLVCQMLDSYITPENVENGSKIFQKLLGYIDSNSNISFFEAADAMSTVKAYCNSEKRASSKIVSGE